MTPQPRRTLARTEKREMQKTTTTTHEKKDEQQYEEMTMDNNHTDLSSDGSKQTDLITDDGFLSTQCFLFPLFTIIPMNL